jgi:hypothetical protein
MKYAVQLLDATNALENAADCFQGDSARIRKLGDGWFLESSAFDACTAAHEVYPIADEILRLIHRVFALYMQLFSPLEIGYVQAFSEADVPTNRALRPPFISSPHILTWVSQRRHARWKWSTK